MAIAASAGRSVIQRIWAEPGFASCLARDTGWMGLSGNPIGVAGRCRVKSSRLKKWKQSVALPVSVAHDFNNLLAVAQGNTAALRAAAPAPWRYKGLHSDCFSS